MCKKLMFLISFVALLGLGNILLADDWDGGGATRDWCDGDNWDDGTTPGPGDDAELKVIDPNVGWASPLVLGPACSADFDRLFWDLGTTDAITLDIVDASFRLMENYESGDGLMTVNVSGTSNVDCWDYRIRWGNHGHGVWNQSDPAITHIANDFRGGDEDDGAFDLNMSGGVLDVGGEFLIGDDGGGVATFTGGDVVLGRVNIAARKGGAVGGMVVSNTEIYVHEYFKLGKDCKDDGGFAYLTMNSGTINCEVLYLSEYSCVDVNVDVSGGLIVVRDEFMVGEGDGDVAVSISGGEIRVESESTMTISSNGSVDVCGTGQLKLKGNKLNDLAQMVCDGSGRLTGCGTAAGVELAYDGTYTIVTGNPDVNPDQAYCPVPANGAERIPSVVSNVVLSWEEGECIGTRGRNIVFFGPADECEAVCADSQGGPYNIGVTRSGVNTWNLGNLPLWECYCWKIDTFCEAGNTVPGNCWTFCTGCEDIPGDCNRDCLLNFLDYATTVDDFGEQIYWP
jgi:hypothetical protein